MKMNLKSYRSPTREDMASWQDQMREAFFEGVGPDDMREIVRKLVADAKAGDKSAVRILLSYGIGGPQINVKQAVIVTDRAPLPCPPSKALPGTSEKLDDLARRAASGKELFDTRDRKAQ